MDLADMVVVAVAANSVHHGAHQAPHTHNLHQVVQHAQVSGVSGSRVKPPHLEQEEPHRRPLHSSKSSPTCSRCSTNRERHRLKSSPCSTHFPSDCAHIVVGGGPSFITAATAPSCKGFGSMPHRGPAMYLTRVKKKEKKKRKPRSQKYTALYCTQDRSLPSCFRPFVAHLPPHHRAGRKHRPKWLHISRSQSNHFSSY